MAITLTWPSSLKKKINEIKGSEKDKPRDLKIFLGSVVMFFFLFYIGSHTKTNNSILCNILTFLIWACGAVVFFFGGEALKENSKIAGYKKRYEGEILVAKALDSLPGEYFIVNDITINGAQIDHIVVGPTGVFCLETKNWNNAGCDAEGNWYRLGRGQWIPTCDSPSKQNATHVMALKKFLNSHGVYVDIHPVIVLTHKGECFNIASRVIPPSNKIICKYPEIGQYLQTREKTLDDNLINKISDIFIRRCG